MTAIAQSGGESQLRSALRRILNMPATQNFIMCVIVVNAAVLGLQTSPAVTDAIGGALRLLDEIALTIFVIELVAKLFVYRTRFFRDAWNVFDFVVVAVTLAPTSPGLSVLRALRILRALRLISMVPEMRLVVQALLKAIPGMGSIIMLLAVVFYIASVMATTLFSSTHPEFFGSIGGSLYTLFQVMTLESWSMGIVRPVMEQHPMAWMFFIPFIMTATFAALNMFIAIIVNAVQDVQKSGEEAAQELDAGHVAILRELDALRGELTGLRAQIAAGRDTAGAQQ
ncbi:MAG: ion transporter [Alphaproteobacteria bacterium]